MATYVGVDIGGTKIACGLVKVGEGKLPVVSSVTKVPTDAMRGGEHVLATVIEQVKGAIARAEEAPLGVGISSAGVVNPKTGDITFANELMPGWGGTHLAAEVTAATGLPCRVLNDVHAHALGEARWGGGKGLPSVLVVAVGTGIGGAVVKGKRIHHGKHLHGGEFGYMVSDASHRILSDMGSTRILAERVADAKGLPREKMDGRKAFALADAGDADALQAVSAMYEALAMAIYNLQYAIDPEIFVLGGAVSERPGFAEEIGKRVDVILKDVGVARIRPIIRPAQFGNDANLLGAVRALLNKQDC